MFKLVTLLVLTTMLSSAYGLYQFNLYVASPTSSPAILNCFNSSTGIEKNVAFVSAVNTVAFPDLVGQTLPAFSIYDGKRRMNVLPAALAQFRLKIPQWGGKVGC